MFSETYIVCPSIIAIALQQSKKPSKTKPLQKLPKTILE